LTKSGVPHGSDVPCQRVPPPRTVCASCSGLLMSEVARGATLGYCCELPSTSHLVCEHSTPSRFKRKGVATVSLQIGWSGGHRVKCGYSTNSAGSRVFLVGSTIGR